MIKKTFENHSLSDKQKDELFQRIEKSLESTAIEKAENSKKRSRFFKYASVAAAIVVVTGVTALIVHLVPKGEPINISTPQSSSHESVESENSSQTESGDNGLNPLHKNPSTLPFYKDSTVMDMEPQPYGYDGFVQVKFAEEYYSDYRFTVAGNFIRREENLYEARFNLYVSKKDTAGISMPGGLELDYTYKGPRLTRESLETLSETLISVIPMTQNGITYPVIALTMPDESGFYDSFYYESFKDEGFKTITSFFVAVDGMGYKLSGQNELSGWYPDFDSKNITVDGNVITDSKGWKIKFDLENKTVFADATIYDEEGQKTKDGLLAFDDSNITEYDGELFYVSGIPYTKVLLDEKTCGEYTFTLFGSFITYTEEPDHYYGYFGLIVSKNGKVIRNNGIVAVDIGSQGGLYTPKDYNYKDMLKVYTMNQNGIEYPLASVTYNITNEDLANSYAKSVTRFFTVRNGMQESFTDGTTNYKNLPADATVNGLSITDDLNFKKITFDFEEREATVITLSEEDADIKKRPYFKDSHIYTEPYENVGNDFDIVRFAEKSYNNYDFVVGGKMERENDGLFKLTLYMYLYQHGELIDINQMSSSLFGNFRFQLSDVDSFAENVLEVRTVHSQSKEYPLAAITCKVDAKELKYYFGDDYSTITDFYMITDNKLNNVIYSYPDYIPGTDITDGVMTDSRDWVTKFDFEKGCVAVDRILPSPSNQEIKDSLVPFTDDNIPVFNGATTSENIPYAKVFIDEQTAGKYTFTLFGNFIKSENYPDNYYGYFDLIVSRNGKAIRDYIGRAFTIDDKSVLAIPKSYDFSNMLKVYSMTQKGIEFPLAVVTYKIPDIETGEISDNSVSRFFTVKNGFGEFFSDNRDYSGLSSDMRTAGLSIKDDKNRKKITFDFLNMKSDVSSMDNDRDVDIKQRPYYKDSYIYTEPYENIKDDFDIVRFAEKSYGKYDFVVGGKMSRNEDGSLSVSLNMYLYKDNKFIEVQNAISDGGFDFTVSEADIESFGDTVLDLKTFEYFGTPFPLAVVTAKPHSSILEDEFPSAGFTTISNFFTIRKTTATVDGAELALFYDGGMHYPDYTKNVTFRDSEGSSIMVDEKGWEVFFNPETLTAHITINTPENVTVQFTGDSSYTNRGLLYLIKTDKAFLDGSETLTYTDKDLSVVPSYSVSADGKIVLESADVGYYIVTGPMFLPTNDSGFTVFEITAKDDNGTINVDLNKADIGTDKVGMAEPEPIDPDKAWLDGQYEFCMQDITFKDVEYSAISIGAKWEQLENADGAYPYAIKGDIYEEEIHKARQKNYSEYCEIYYNGIIYTGKEVYDNFLIREVMPYHQPDYRKTILYIRKDLKTEGDAIYGGDGFRSVNYGHDSVTLKDIKLKVEGIDKKPEDFHDVWVIVLNELEVYMHRNNLNVDGYTDNFHYYDFVDGLSINENCELVVPEDYPHTGILSGYTVIGVTHLVEDEYGSRLEFEEKLPVYLINSDGSAEFSFWIEKNMFG